MIFFRCIALLAATLAISTASAQDVILAEIDGHPFTLEEFEREYAKTVGSEAAKNDSLAEYTDFLNRYINFRIKLKEARTAGYFEDEELISEINGYRASFAKPYLIDNEVLEPLIRDVYERRKEFIHASHIMALLPRENPSPADTLRAWNKIAALQDSLAMGIPFADLAFRYSEDPSANSPTSSRGYRGDLGRFTGGNMILPFEIAAYSTPVGEVSDIIRSAFGYHILKVYDREDAKPDYLASHIMVRFSGNTAADSSRGFARMDSLKTLIDEGIPFAEVAMAHSDDQMSAPHGGSLQAAIEFGTPNIDRTFHDSLFTLETPGEISDVVETPYGLHLIQLNEILPVRTMDQEYDGLSRLVQALPRSKTAETALAKSLRELYTSSVDTLLLTRFIGGIEPDSIQTYLQQLATIDSVAATPLISLQDSVYSLKQFANFASTQASSVNDELSSTESALVYADAFLDDRVLFYHSFKLEHTDEEFKRIMQDFQEGLALFAIMEDSVWNASSKDTLHLTKHYEANIERYQWPDRHRLIELSGTSDSLLARAKNLLDIGTTWADLEARIKADSIWSLQIDTVLVADSTGSVYDQALGLTPGQYTDVLSVRVRRLILYMDGIEPARSKTFEESITEISTEIQEILEQRLHQRLRSKYQVKIFPDRLKMAFQ
ncbi:MAG: peptidylprolyl isomerase [Bacteroidetes bacterium]|nr:peptidylprolyl isomerase [Bacteroidota bacterium]MCY4205320.1 peptidylprolyl isomerase [Bacteroidota bacterium]